MSSKTFHCSNTYPRSKQTGLNSSLQHESCNKIEIDSDVSIAQDITDITFTGQK